MATFCPYCDEEIGKEVMQAWVGDYLTYFEFECEKCGKKMEIEVEAIPHFYPMKLLKETRKVKT